MAINDPIDSEGFHPVNRLLPGPTLAELVPATTIKNLVSEEEARLAELECKEFAERGKELDRLLEFEIFYQMYYDDTRERMAAGESHSAILSALAELLETDDSTYARAAREGVGDALAGRERQH